MTEREEDLVVQVRFLRLMLGEIAAIKNEEDGSDWAEIELARSIARSAISASEKMCSLESPGQSPSHQ